MATNPAKTSAPLPDDAVGDFVELSTALMSALAAERRAQSRLIATLAQAKAEGDRQQQILAHR